MSDEPIEHELLRQAVWVLEECKVETTTEHFGENTRVCVTLQAEPELLERCALGVIYAFGVLSFHDARPRGVSGMDFVEKDDWSVADMLRCLSFPPHLPPQLPLLLRRLHPRSDDEDRHRRLP